MLWLVLKVLLYAIFAFKHANAAQISDSNSANREMPRINSVEPIKNAGSFDRHTLRRVVCQKLKEVYANQFPGFTYSIRGYDIENWPPGIDLYGMRDWNKSQILRINEGIPFYRFIRRRTMAVAEYSAKTFRHNLKEMECLKNAHLKGTNIFKPTMRMMFERFKAETEQPDAVRIDWRLLDRTKVPTKYDEVPLNSATFSNKLVYKNPEIVNNIHFHKNINACGGNSDGKGNIIISEEYPEDILEDISVYSDELEIDESEFDEFMSTLDNSYESGFEIDVENLGKISTGANKDYDSGVNDDRKSESSMELKPLKTKNPLRPLERQRKIVKNELDNAFKAQYPDEVFNLRLYEILNWPEGVHLTPCRWTTSEVERIRENMEKFVFKKRNSVFSVASELGADQLGNLNGIMDNSMTYEKIHKILFKRYRQETGEFDASRIDWHKLHSRDIPAKYDGIVFNCTTMRLKSVYTNSEIVNNIHFSPIAKHKRKRECKSDR